MPGCGEVEPRWKCRVSTFARGRFERTCFGRDLQRHSRNDSGLSLRIMLRSYALNVPEIVRVFRQPPLLHQLRDLLVDERIIGQLQPGLASIHCVKKLSSGG